MSTRFRLRPRRRTLARLLVLLLVLLGLLLVTQALWMPLKAVLAQSLLRRAYDQAPGQARPWRWADFAAVAELRVPRLGLRQLVLDQASPRALAFGPGLQIGVAGRDPRGQRLVLAGHRDSHFAWLAELRLGDELQLAVPQRASTAAASEVVEVRYRVAQTQVFDTRRVGLAASTADGDGDGELLLTTCWPFDALVAGGPLRYAVRALPLLAPP